MQALSGSVRDLAEGRSRWIVSSLLAIIALGIGIRLYVAEALVGKAFNDTAIVGLMTMHELAGRFYAFYWGPVLHGLDGVAVDRALLRAVRRERTVVVGLLPWFVLFTIAIYGLTRLCGGGRAAIIAAFLSATAPAYLQYHEMMPLGGYPETLALGTVLLWLALRVVYRPLSPASQTAHLVAIGAVGGLAFWTNWLVLPYFVIVGLYLFLWNPFLLGRSAAWLAFLSSAASLSGLTT